MSITDEEFNGTLFYRHSSPDSSVVSKSPSHLNFIYDDTDRFEFELIDIYAYGEYEKLSIDAQTCFFKRLSKDSGNIVSWSFVEYDDKVDIAKYLIDGLTGNQNDFYECIRALLFLIHGGNFQDIRRLMIECSRENALILYRCGIIKILTHKLNQFNQKIEAADDAQAEVEDLNETVILFHSILELIRTSEINDAEKELIKKQLISISNGEKKWLTSITINIASQLIFKHVSPNFLASKLIMLSWKMLIFTLGGMQKIMETRTQERIKYNLPGPPNRENPENSIAIMRKFCDCIDLIEAMSSGDGNDYCIPADNRRCKRSKVGIDTIISEMNKRDSNRSVMMVDNKFPWKAKCTRQTILDYLNENRKRYLGFCFPDDDGSVIGLPPSVKHSYEIMKAFLYVPLSQQQITSSDLANQCPLTCSTANSTIEEDSLEMFYRDILLLLPFHIEQLSEQFGLYTSSKTIESIYSQHSNLLYIERHGATEALVSLKAITGFIILFLKHLKVNHIYQFEFVCQQFPTSGFLDKILTFFTKDIVSHIQYVAARAKPRERLSSTGLVKSLHDPIDNFQMDRSWCAVFIIVNILRITNKLGKGSHSRSGLIYSSNFMKSLRKMFNKQDSIDGEDVFECTFVLNSPTFTNIRSLVKPLYSARHCPLVQYYNIKLVKILSRYCSRQWRKVNMYRFPIMYHMVRHRFNDDWAYSICTGVIDPDEEMAQDLKISKKVYEFHMRRYLSMTEKYLTNEPNVDPKHLWMNLSDIRKIMDGINERNSRAERDNLPTWFLENVHHWVQREVIDSNINWDEVLDSDGGTVKLI
ncbi:hypothetical protein ACOME3_005877 [Neoechinorhynchus agilis]